MTPVVCGITGSSVKISKLESPRYFHGSRKTYNNIRRVAEGRVRLLGKRLKVNATISKVMFGISGDVVMCMVTSHCWSKKVQPARGWTAADICIRDGAPIPFLGKPTVAPCRLAGPAPHKSGGRQVKSWPDDTHKQTHSSHLDL